MLRGIDVSHYQRFDDYESFNSSKLSFVFIKATEGIYKDRDFLTHSEGFSKTCLFKGAYHFLRFGSPAKDQAENFIKVVKPVFSSFDLPPVLDIEDLNENLTPGQCEVFIQEWLTLVETAFEVKPIIYTGGWYWTDPAHLANTTKFSGYHLWTSIYRKRYLPIYGGWKKPTFWQYTDKGTMANLAGNGASIDLNYYLGTIDTLWDLTKQKEMVPSAKYEPKVEAVQYILNQKQFSSGKPDGIFGDFTLTAFQDWLEHNGLAKVDKITPKHWQLLFGLEDIPEDSTGTTTSPVVTPSPSTTTFPESGIVTSEKLNIRTGAGQSNPMVALPLSKGQKVEIIDESNGWYKVKAEIEGWVSKDYIS